MPKEASHRCVVEGDGKTEPNAVVVRLEWVREDEDWKDEDPNIHLSPWWYTSDPSEKCWNADDPFGAAACQEEMKLFWDIDNADIQQDVTLRMDEGRGAMGLPVPALARS